MLAFILEYLKAIRTYEFGYKLLFNFLYLSDLSECTPACQKKASDHIIDGYESPSGFWGLSSPSGRADSALLTAKSLSSSCVLFHFCHKF